MPTQRENGLNDALFLASNLKMLRKRFQWSQEEFASRIGLNRGNIASYENGSTEPRVCSLLKMSDLFQVGMRELVFEDLSLRDSSGNGNGHVPAPDMARFQHRACELEAVFKGLHTCCMFKTRQWGEEVPRDMHILLMHFEELYQAAQTMLLEHQNLIRRMHGCSHPEEKD